MNRLSHIFILLLVCLRTVALDVPWPEQNVWPESPQAKAIRQVMMPTPALVTGACEFSVPIYTIEVEGFKIPITLQYRSNGIKPEDDPQPIGYGWVLTPPLRVSRQIMGRPDEYFTFVGDKGAGFIQGDYDKGFRSVTMWGALDRSFHPYHYDTEHDFYTFYLLDKSLTMIYKDGRMQGVGCDEYQVECGELFSYFKVTDPNGIVYDFSTQGECVDNFSMRTEWLLTSITLQSGTVIEVKWDSHTHTGHGFKMIGPTEVYYNTKLYPFTYVDDYSSSEYKTSHQYFYTQDLGSIVFPGGKLECNYGRGDATNMTMLENITVSNGDKTVFKAELGHSPNRRLLSDVTIQGDGSYTFEYDPTAFNRADMVDWWGYYNGKDNRYLLSPKVKMTHKVNGDLPIHGADRSVDKELMRAYILTKATYPTGGSAEWEYEVHRFQEQKAPDWVFDYLENEISLSEGGGLRVKSITLKENKDDGNPRVKTYIYGEDGNGLAQVTAVPFLHTFISETPYWALRNYMGYVEGMVDNYLTINRFSDYLTGCINSLPIWYNKVVEIDAEGKTEYEFKKVCPDNINDREWGMAWPSDINEAFSKGPVQTCTTEFKSSSNGYRPIRKTEFDYESFEKVGFTQINCFTAYRLCLFLYGSEYTPDFGPDRFRGEGLMPWQIRLGDIPMSMKDGAFDRDTQFWYDGLDYNINPQTERLVSRKTTTYHENGETSVTESYEYVPNTGLISATVVSNGSESVRTEYTYSDSYTDSASPAIANELKERNIRGMVTGVKETCGSKTVGYSVKLGKFGQTFRPRGIWQHRDGVEWSNAIYNYDDRGFLTGMHSSCNSVTKWTRDIYGNPLTMSVADDSIVSRAEWKPLVGVSTLTTPAGARQEFLYDTKGRLTSVKLNSRKLEAYSYRINQDGNNYITKAVWTDYGYKYTSYSYFDGLGRNRATVTRQPDRSYLTEISEFDVMGRLSRRWNPVAYTSQTPDSEGVKAAAVSDYGDDYPYTSFTYEASQRELPVSTTKSGRAWHSGGRSATVRYLVNDADAHSCVRYTPSSGGVTSEGNYPKGLLTIEVTEDEDGISTEVYKDFRGLTVCRKQGGLVTDYVYDDFGELRYILPPALSGTAKRTDADMQRYAYWYDYDERGRLVSKKLPGLREWLYRYDIVDRLGAELSPHQEAGVWRLYCYDNADRQVIAFDCRMTDAEATYFAYQTNTAEPDWGAFYGYAVPDVPDEAEVAWARFYDNYQFISDNRLGSEYGWDEDSSPGWVYSEYSPSSKGLLTGVYDGKNFESYHYNTDGQVIQSYSTGFNKGRTNYVYTYDGQLQKTVHDPCDPKVPKVTEEYDYDVMGRQTAHRVLLHDSNTARTDTARMSMTYNSLGQLSSRAFGACRQDFTYDIHGWLRSSETTTGELRSKPQGGTIIKVPKVISEKLEYAEGLFPCYNGNISSKVMDGEVYSYSYDGNNRLTSASMYRSNADRFSATYSYDAMSNLTSVKRRGIVDMVDMDGPKMESYGTLDDISISYDGNRISSVTAKSDAVAFEGMTGMGRNESDMSVSYDDAGRIVSDETRGITLIEYNNDGHPVRMVLDEGHEFHDAWDNLGNHLSTTIYMMQPSGVLNELPLLVKEYRGNGQIITSKPSLGGGKDVMTRFAGGYFMDNDVYYYVTDYQGNNVAVVDGDGKIVEQTNYYPYGEPWREATEQPFLYAGNERLRLFGLNEYDFIARRYNPLLASFTTWDPLAEKYPWLSPYAYCAGNPINYIDPNGERIVVWEDDEEWEYRKVEGVYGFYNKSNNPYEGGNSFVYKLADNLQLISEGLIGGKMVSDLINIPEALYFNSITEGNVFYTESNTILWNPDKQTGALSKTSDGGVTDARPSYIGLAHEMAHAFDFMVRKQPDESPWAVSDNGTPVDRSDLFAGLVENGIRAEHNIGLRISYFNDKICYHPNTHNFMKRRDLYCTGVSAYTIAYLLIFGNGRK